MASRTDAILSQFAKSWFETELFLGNLFNNYPGFHRLQPIIQFIAALKEKGEQNYFRLGTSMHDLMISRSVVNGLRRDQKYIIIKTYDDKFEVRLRDGYKTYREYMVDDLSDERLTKLIDTLRRTVVD